MTPVLAIENLDVHYGRAHALQGVSLSLDRGVLAVVGRNGMGKTTLCNAITGLVRGIGTTAGSVRFLGQELIGLPANRITRLGVGYVPQGRRVWPSLTVHEHLLLSKNSNRSTAWTIDRIYATFPRLAERKANGGAQLSGGEQQMLAISRALLLNPKLLVMDEPTEGLAPVIVRQVEAMLKSLVADGQIAVLLIEQNLGVAIAVADTVDVMVNGRITRSMPVAELSGDRALQQRLLGVRAADDEEEVTEQAQAEPAAEEVRVFTVKRAEGSDIPSATPEPRAVRGHTRWGSVDVDRPIEKAEEKVAATDPRVVEFPVAASAGRAAYVAGTFDTKGRELGYLRACIEKLGLRVVTVDLSTSGRPAAAMVSAREVARSHPRFSRDGERAVFTGERGSAVTEMALAFEHFIARRRDLGGLISAGGSGNTALATPAMRRLPIGVPKVMVSTVASGDVKPYVGPSDICMMYSVTDVSGINRISEKVLANAAHALAGMIFYSINAKNTDHVKQAIGLTMFGLTTPCVQALTPLLEADYDCIVFHATGTGGQSMEKLAESKLLSAVIDVTTTEIADEIVGGVLSAGPARMDVFARLKMPYVGSCGALDMVNFWAMETVPAQFRGRRLHRHNANVTLMRTTPEENARIGAFIAAKLNRMEGPVRFLIPEGGVSGLDVPGGPFWDPAADKALFDAISSNFLSSASRKLTRLPLHINDPQFAAALAANFRDIQSREGQDAWPASRATRS